MIKRRLLSVLLCLAMVFSLAGCSIGGRTVYFDHGGGHHTVFRIGDMKCSDSEAMTYLITAKNQYGSVEGTSLWTGEFDTSIITDSLKDAVLSHLTKVYVLNLYALDQGIELTDKENEAIKAAAEEYFDSLSKQEKTFLDIKKKDVEGMYKRYALAEKVNTSLMSEVDNEVSEDEARIMQALVLFVTEEEDVAQIQSQLEEGYSFERVAATFTTLDSYLVTFGRNEYPLAVDNVVFNLDTDQVSDVIQADGGYYFFQCLNKYDEDLSEQNKEIIVSRRKEQVVADIISGLETEYFSELNQKLWETVNLEDTDEYTTSNFFSVLDKHLRY